MEAGLPKEGAAVPSVDAAAEPNRSPAGEVAGDARAADPKPVEAAENIETENTSRDGKPEMNANISTPASAANIPAPVATNPASVATNPASVATNPASLAPKPATSHAVGGSAAKPGASAPNVDSNEAVMKLVKSGKLSSQEAQAVKGLAKDHAALKIKVDRLKGLLGRSAKAQREAKGVFPVKSFVCHPFRSGRHKF